jgi:hypothetical protein
MMLVVHPGGAGGVEEGVYLLGSKGPFFFAAPPLDPAAIVLELLAEPWPASVVAIFNVTTGVEVNPILSEGE